MRRRKAQARVGTAGVLEEGSIVLTGAHERAMPMLSSDGQFDPVALEAIQESWGTPTALPAVTPDDEIGTRKFVPVHGAGAITSN